MNATFRDSIGALEHTSKVLEEYANKPENYNSPYAMMLESISWEMHKQANDLKEIGNFFGGL